MSGNKDYIRLQSDREIYSRSSDYKDGCLKWQKEHFARRCRGMGFA